MKNASVKIEKNFSIARVDERIFSSFIEHLGRAVYSGIYEPGHRTADEDGFRMDVMELVKELGVSHVRYPGGNFLSGYDWKDGIGPKEGRPKRLDLAWHTIESNQFGIHEFVKWSQKAKTKIMGAVNMGTGTPKDAGELLEYCNFPGGTYWSDLRSANGDKDPFQIKLWCIGNEMDGAWQTCHLDADDYGKKALETAKIMKWVDESIELVVCGSATTLQDTYPEWDRKVLEYVYNEVDYLSLHRYYENEGNDLDFMASFVDMENFINTIASTCDYVKAVKRSNKTMMLSFDEWNVWYQQKQVRRDWMEAPDILEDRYSLLDALTFAGMGMTLMNHADRVKIACLAQLVNVIAPIFTERDGRVIKQSIFYPFFYLSKYGRGTVLKPVITAETVETRYGEAPLLHTSIVHDEENGAVNVFLLNISGESMMVNLDFCSFGQVKMTQNVTLSGDDLGAVNSFESPKNVVPSAVALLTGEHETCSIELPAHSFNFVQFETVREGERI